MEQQRSPRAGSVGPDDLMRYLDGEMTPEERDHVDSELAQSTELNRELAKYRSLKEDVQGLTFRAGPPNRSVWDDVNRKLNRPMGFAFLVAGLVIWLTYGTFLFATSTASRWEKLGTAAIAIGMLQLLASVIWDRYRDWQTDPYKSVHR
ncbi:MAG: anti-sigma factor family protein [Longimicrobiales bacterium]